MESRRVLREPGLWGAIVLALVLLGCGRAVAASEEKAVPVDECIAALRFLAAQNEGNYRKIETWQGTYRFVDRSPEWVFLRPGPEPPPGPESRPNPDKDRPVQATVIREGQVHFAMDVAGDKLWVDYQEDRTKTHFFTTDGKDSLTVPRQYRPNDQKTILTADSVTTMTAINWGPLSDYKEDPFHVGGKSGRVAKREAYRLELRLREHTQIIDPRRFFSVGGARLLFDALNVDAVGLVEERARAEPLVRLTKTGGPGQTRYVLTLKYRSGSPDDEKVGLPWQFIRFSQPDGFLPVEECMHDRDGSPQVSRSWVYVSIDGVRIPKEFHYKFVSNPGTKLVLDRHLVLVEARLNQPLPAGTFSVESLQLRAGDRFVDDIERKLLLHDGVSLVTTEEFVPVQRRHQTLPYILWAGSGLAAVVVAAIAWERWRRRRFRI